MRSQCFRCGTVYEVEVALCWRCGGTFLGPVFRVPASRLDGLPEVATARELCKRDFRLVQVPAYPEIQLGLCAVTIVYGPPGSGKSTLATRWCLGVRAVYVAAEEGVGAALAARVRRVGLCSENVLFVSKVSVDGLLDIIQNFKPVFLIVDSLSATTFQPQDLRRLVNTMPLQGLVAVQQVTKSGAARGTLGFLHEADVVIAVDGFIWKIEKSRYQSPIEGEVWMESSDLPEEGEDDGRGTNIVPLLSQGSRNPAC